MQELDLAFQKSKSEIIKQCSIGVRKFEPHRKTALATDWSRTAVGCWLTQKFCDCLADIPGCCDSGWQTVHISSKFNSPAVSRYHPIEGEAFAAAWALDKCKLFVLGHQDLVLAVDHKPLLAILGNQELSDILNPSLMNFKLKSLAYQFKPIYIPGKNMWFLTQCQGGMIPQCMLCLSFHACHLLPIMYSQNMLLTLNLHLGWQNLSLHPLKLALKNL